MIYSSLNRLFFISVSLRRSPIQIEGASAGDVKATHLLQRIYDSRAHDLNALCQGKRRA